MRSKNAPNLRSSNERTNIARAYVVDRLNGITQPVNRWTVASLYSYQPTGGKWVLLHPKHYSRNFRSLPRRCARWPSRLSENIYDRIRARFFWPGMSTSVSKYIASCTSCQRRKRPTSPSAGQLHPIPCSAEPFEVVGTDLYGPIPAAFTGYRWVVTAVDHLTRNAETAPVRTGCAEEVALAIPSSGTAHLVSFCVTVGKRFSQTTFQRSSMHHELSTNRLPDITLRRTDSLRDFIIRFPT